ncbi:hypothetical protein GQ600_16357 [Phytophthora cactorum]|nr:hypothetical protein GQ600_16357 [Phytophthora cactorum]
MIDINQFSLQQLSQWQPENAAYLGWRATLSRIATACGIERLRKAGVKLSSRLLIYMATTMIEASTHDEVNRAYTFSGKLFDSLVTPRRIQDFTEHQYIVYRKLKCKTQVSEAKLAQIEQFVAKHLARCTNYQAQLPVVNLERLTKLLLFPFAVAADI